MAVFLLMLASLRTMQWGFQRLVWAEEPAGARDLRQRHTEVHRWFAGQPVYGVLSYASYPPASNPILWPFVGWLEFTPARWLWAASTVAALGWMSYLAVRASGAGTRLERLCAGLLPVSISGAGVAIANGQLPLHVIPAMVAGVGLLQRARGHWFSELGGVALVIAAFVKPSIAIPFFWLVLFVPGTWRPAALVVAGYAALTLLAAAFQPAGLVSLVREWTEVGVHKSGHSALHWSYGSLPTWSMSLGLERWSTVFSLLALIALGVWTFFHRRRDVWLLLGVTGLVSRLWTYHGLYDDVLIVLPMIALFRIAKQSPMNTRDGVAAGALLAITVLAMAMPLRWWQGAPPWCWLITIGHAVVWIAVLIYLVNRARSDRQREDECTP